MKTVRPGAEYRQGLDRSIQQTYTLNIVDEVLRIKMNDDVLFSLADRLDRVSASSYPIIFTEPKNVAITETRLSYWECKLRAKIEHKGGELPEETAGQKIIFKQSPAIKIKNGGLGKLKKRED